MTHFHIITLFPEAIAPYADASMLGRAQRDGKIRVSFYNPRDFTKDKHKRVDQRPYGGGPGMVLAAEPIIRAAKKAIGRKQKVKVILCAAQGKQFDTAYAKRLAGTYKHVVIIAGHYEGIDARVKKALGAEEVSIGPFVLTGGEVPALAIVDATARYVPGVLGNDASREDTRTASPEVYTRPEAFTDRGRTYRVPEVLLSGDHKKIEEYRKSRRNQL